jgi:acyl carrier protein
MRSTDSNSVKHQIHQIIKQTLNLDPDNIDPNTIWYDLGAESFDMVELIIALRDNFQIKLDTQELSQIKTLNQLITYIETTINN